MVHLVLATADRKSISLLPSVFDSPLFLLYGCRWWF